MVYHKQLPEIACLLAGLSLHVCLFFTDAWFSVMPWWSNSHWDPHPLLCPHQLGDMEQ